MSVPEDDLNQHNSELYRDLPRELDPGPAVQDRIVRALRSDGLLRPARVSHRTAWMLRVAAAFVLFAGGLAAGEYHGARRTEHRLASLRDQDLRDAAMLVQRTGSAYVDALAQLAQASAAGDSAQTVQGREVAESAFRAAATELHQVAPDDPFTMRLIDAMSAGRQDNTASRPAMRRVIYY